MKERIEKNLAELLKVTPEFPLFGDDEKIKVYKYISSADDEKGYKINNIYNLFNYSHLY